MMLTYLTTNTSPPHIVETHKFHNFSTVIILVDWYLSTSFYYFIERAAGTKGSNWRNINSQLLKQECLVTRTFSDVLTPCEREHAFIKIP